MNPKATKLIVAGITSATLLSGVGAATVATATAADSPLIAAAAQNFDDLTGIDINGTPLADFSTSKTDYQVTVPTLSSMTTTPKFANQKTTTVATVDTAPSGVHGVVVNLYDANSTLVKTYTIHVTETAPEQPSVDMSALKKSLQDKVNAMQTKLDDWHTQYANRDAMANAVAQGKQALTSDDATTMQSAIDALDKVDTSKSTEVTAIADALKDLTAQQKQFSKYSESLQNDIDRVSKYSDKTATSLDDDTKKAEEIKQVVARMKSEEAAVKKQQRDKTVQDALDKLNKELSKGFTYSSDLNTKIDKAKQVTPDKATTQDEANQLAKQILDTLDAIAGKGNERIAYDKALDKASKIDTNQYLQPGASTLDKTVTNQKSIDPDTASATTLTNATQALNRAVDALRPASWTLDGATLTNNNGTWSATFDHQPTTLEAVASDGTKTTLTYQQTEAFRQGDGQLGVGTVEGDLNGSWRDQQFAIHVSEPTGAETAGKVNGHDLNAFTLKDGVWTAQGTTELGVDTDLAAVPATTVTLSDGTTLTNPQVGDLETQKTDGKTLFSRTLTFTGKDSHGTPVAVTATASTVFNDHVSLSIHGTSADGKSYDLPVYDALASGLQSQYTLDQQAYERTADQLSLNATAGSANVRDIHVAQGVLDDGTRVFTVTLTADKLDGHTVTPETKTVRITVPFAQPKREVGNMDAALQTITLNDQPIEGFNDNQVDYTVHVGANEKVKLSPKAKDGQTVVAGDITQTAYTTKQSWTVTKGDQKRVYTVTVVRDHTEPTADERFTPADSDGRVSDKPNPSQANTDLASVGFTVNGEYTAAKGDTFAIPEGGTFGYESYQGQLVTVDSVKTAPMTYKVTVGVLSADRDHWAAHQYTVTYLTEATHKAELTGINVDGTPIAGFSADKTEYTIGVDNPDRYTVVPQFDKMTGMSVSTHKDGRTVTITVTSADGQVTRVYTLHMMSKPAAHAAQLAETGSNVVLIAGAAILAAIAGLGFALWKRHGGNANIEDTSENQTK